jgi:hypothetical protein
MHLELGVCSCCVWLSGHVLRGGATCADDVAIASSSWAYRLGRVHALRLHTLTPPFRLALLWRALSTVSLQVDSEMRIRFTSPHPKDFADAVLQTIAAR